jgi:hypothetical protein
MDKPDNSKGEAPKGEMKRTEHGANEGSGGARSAFGGDSAAGQDSGSRSKIHGKGLFGTTRGSPAAHYQGKKNLWPWMIGVSLVVIIGAFFRWYWIDAGKQFPILAPGSYIGTLSGVLTVPDARVAPDGEDEKSTSVPFYVERAQESEELFVAILLPGWKPQLVSTVIHSSGSSAPRWILPLLLSQGAKRIQLTGLPLAADQYGGEVVDLSSGSEGSWRLEPIRALPGDVGQGAQEVRLWLMLKAELEEVQARIGEFERRVPEQRAEIEKLTKLLTEGEELRSRANEKFGSVKEERLVADRDLKGEQQKVQRLESSLEIAQKVTGMGKLVSLSRESLEREWRIVDSLLRSSVGSSADTLDEEYERATKTLELQGQVAAERAEVERLSAPQQKRPDPRAQPRPFGRRQS